MCVYLISSSYTVHLRLEVIHSNCTKNVATAVSVHHTSRVRVINVWNSLPADRVDFSSFAAFKQTIEQIDFSQFSFGYDN